MESTNDFNNETADKLSVLLLQTQKSEPIRLIVFRKSKTLSSNRYVNKGIELSI